MTSLTLTRRRYQSSIFAYATYRTNFGGKIYLILLGDALETGSSHNPEEWILRTVEYPVREVIQKDGRIRRWSKIDEMDGRYLRVVLLPDRETVHNAFFDRTFEP